LRVGGPFGSYLGPSDPHTAPNGTNEQSPGTGARVNAKPAGQAEQRRNAVRQPLRLLPDNAALVRVVFWRRDLTSLSRPTANL
jgi:hypothetical protein